MPASPTSSTTCPRPSALCAQRASSSPSLARPHQGRQTMGRHGVQPRLCPALRQELVHEHGLLHPLRVCPQGLAGKKALDEPMGGGTDHYRIGCRQPCSRAARLGVSPRANCSCRPAPPMAPTTAAPMDAQRTASRCPRSRVRRVLGRDALHHLQAGSPGSLRVIFMRLGIAKIDQQAIAQVLGNVPVEALDDLCRGGLVGSYHLTVVFGVQLPGETGRVHQVTEQHGEPRRSASGGAVRWRRVRPAGVALLCFQPHQSRPGPCRLRRPRVVGVEEFFLQIRQGVVVQVELALEARYETRPRWRSSART